MFKNLKAEMERYDISVKQLAEIAGISSKTLYLKLSGKTEFTYSQIIAISNFFNGMSFEYLFAVGDNKSA